MQSYFTFSNARSMLSIFDLGGCLSAADLPVHRKDLVHDWQQLLADQTTLSDDYLKALQRAELSYAKNDMI